MNLTPPGGTATLGSDYASLPLTLTIPAGATSVTLLISPIDDALVEGSETVSVGLAPGAGYELGSTVAGTITIADNDSSSGGSGSGGPSVQPAGSGGGCGAGGLSGLALLLAWALTGWRRR